MAVSCSMLSLKIACCPCSSSTNAAPWNCPVQQKEWLRMIARLHGQLDKLLKRHFKNLYQTSLYHQEEDKIYTLEM